MPYSHYHKTYYRQASCLQYSLRSNCNCNCFWLELKLHTFFPKIVLYSQFSRYITQSHCSLYLYVYGRSVSMLITFMFGECIDMRCKHHMDMPYCDSHKICIIDKQLEQLPTASNLQCSLCSNCNCNYNCFHSNSNCTHVLKAVHHSVVAGYFTQSQWSFI